MGVVAYIVNHKQIMAELQEPPVIINELPIDMGTKEGREQLLTYISCRFDSDTIPAIPSCLHGCTTGESRKGHICPHCNTRVVSLVEASMESGVWLAPPEGISHFIHPEIWNVLNPRLTPLKSFSVLEWICDPNTTATLPAYQGVLDQYRQQHKRGITYFIENFDAIFDFVISSKLCKLSIQEKEELRQFIATHRDAVFQPYLPLPHRIFAVSEKTSAASYADEKTTDLLDAVFTVTSTISSPIALSHKRRESHATQAISKLAACYRAICTKFIGGKYGLVRRQLIGSRLHFTGRAVITSISGAHHFEELHIPWPFAVQIFEHHLCSKLARLGYSVNDALAFLEDNTLQWNPLLRRLFDEIIAESPPLTDYPQGVFKDIDENPKLLTGYPVLLQRNPSLTRQSAQNLRVTVIKDDVTDWTISVPLLNLVGWNGDFDGDELNLLLCLDRKMLAAFSRFRPHLSARSLRRPRRLSDYMKIHAPVAATWANYVHHSEK